MMLAHEWNPRTYARAHDVHQGTDLSRWSAEDLDAVASTSIAAPRKTLGWKTPAEALSELLEGSSQSRV